jgi:hypothetical protein
MDLAFLQDLKTDLINTEDFKKVWESFFDWLDQNQEFIDLGTRFSDERLETAIAEIGLQMFPNDGTVTMMLLIRLPDQQFIHGNVHVGGRAGGVIYFEDVSVGLVAVCDHFPSDETKFARFSTMPYKPGGTPSRN